MSRYERGRFFEALCELRGAHGRAPDDDRRSVISIEDVITYAEAVMVALAAEDALADTEPTVAEEETSSTGDPRD